MSLFGLGEIGAAGIRAASDIVTNAATNATNFAINKANNKANRELHEADNAFNALEAEKAYGRQVEQWERENAYNSPVQLMERYAEAGLNPALMMEGQQATASSTPSVPNASSAPAIPMQPFRLETIQPAQAYANLLEAFSRVDKNKADANLSSSQANQIDQTLDETLKGLQLDNDSKWIANYWQPIINQGNYNKSLNECLALWQQAQVYVTQGDLNKAETALAEAKTKYTNWQSKEQEIIANTTSARIQASINEARSRTASNYASAEHYRSQVELNHSQAELNRALKDTEDSLRDVKIDLSSSQAALFRDQGSKVRGETLLIQSERNKVIEETLKIIEETNHIRFDNAQRSRLQYYLDMELEMRALQMQQNYFNPFHFLGAAALPLLKGSK